VLLDAPTEPSVIGSIAHRRDIQSSLSVGGPSRVIESESAARKRPAASHLPRTGMGQRDSCSKVCFRDQLVQRFNARSPRKSRRSQAVDQHVRDALSYSTLVPKKIAATLDETVPYSKFITAIRFFGLGRR